MAKIYEMHRVQVAILRKMASDELGALVLMEPREGDPPDLKRDWDLTQDLIKLGLVEDITVSHKKQIAKFVKAAKGRKYLAFRITYTGRLLFDYCDDPDCTVHKLGDPMRRYPC